MREENLSFQPDLSPQEWGPGYEIWQSLRDLLAQRGPEGTTSLVRMASHLVLVLVAVGVLAFSRLTLPGWDIVQVREETAQIGPKKRLGWRPASRWQPSRNSRLSAALSPLL
jgi:cytochrome c-type biogenesis protein CcmH/NrfG